MNYYGNKAAYILLLLSITFVIALDFSLIPIMGDGINYSRTSELIVISMPYLFNCAGAMCLAMILAGRLRAANCGYEPYINCCSTISITYSFVVSTIFAFGLRGKIKGFSLDSFWYDYAPLSSLYFNFLIFTVLYFVFRLSKTRPQ
ncbi:hypothetical protein HG263_06185 [Pseudoalteromonas sp. JBTF-M23]|uniref:Uncharacterized protein n=1 Tax=Pseudoalteromonas caenipelagi TaxID=2726988 RepID=A0A849VB92_9GAMM|nr:hypothetical protein [Pseudoalteromonas caenipelagi]NOU50128.1 hypothetical protein [Pseudoalteromonas caenipelagi]